MKIIPNLSRLLLPVLAVTILLSGCQEEPKDCAELKGIKEELQKINNRLEEIQRNDRIRREGRALQNQKSYFE